MFDIAWSEFGIVLLVGLLLLGPQDMAKIIKSIRDWCKKISHFQKDFFAALDLQDAPKTTTIIDQDGIEREAYDLSDVMPEIMEDDSTKPQE